MPISYSRPQLEAMLKGGQSIIINGRHIERLEDLPSESELALGDRERTQAALAAHDQQIANLLAERKKLQAQLDATPEPTAPEPVRQPAQAGDRPAQPPPGEQPKPPPAEAPKPPEPPKPADAPKPPPPGPRVLEAPRPGPMEVPEPPAVRSPGPPDEEEDRGPRGRGRR